MNTCFWHNFLPALSHGWHFSTDGMFVFCHTDSTDCTDFFSQSEWKEWKRIFSYVTRREHILISHGKHRISAARGFLSHGLHGFIFLNQNEKNEKEYSLMSLGWHESSYLNQILKYWKRTSCFLNQWWACRAWWGNEKNDQKTLFRVARIFLGCPGRGAFFFYANCRVIGRKFP